jgi:hypothetical protein
MMDDFFSDPVKSCPFCQDGDVAVHIAVQFNAFDYRMAVGFEATVEVMEPDTRDTAGSPVIDFSGNGFGDRVMSFLLPTRHQVETLFPDHAVHFGYFVGAVLKVCIHGKDHVTLCF